MIRSSTVHALVGAALAASVASSSAIADVRVGTLECRGPGVESFVVGSVNVLGCVFHPTQGKPYNYTAIIRRLGVDIGIIRDPVLSWAVLAPTVNVGPNDLAGTYNGLSAGATFGVGGSANVLVGGSHNSFALQPLSVQRQTGVNLAAGFARMELSTAMAKSPAVHRRAKPVAAPAPPAKPTEPD
jgi:hypothetical protein